MPCTLIVLDEVQQYIGESNDRSVIVTEVVEAVSKQLESQVMIVCAGQSALTDVPLLRKLMDRFTIRVPLSDAEVEQVTRKVLLQKKPAALQPVRKLFEQHAGEVARQLQGTRIGETVEDRAVQVDDYPLLPVRRRFWEQCFGRLTRPVRTVSCVPSCASFMTQLRGFLIDRWGRWCQRTNCTKRWLRKWLIQGSCCGRSTSGSIKVGASEGTLARRVCGLVFLIGKLKRDGEADIGVRANKEHIADLLVDDLTADNGKLRARGRDDAADVGRTRRADAGGRRISTTNARGIGMGSGVS